MGSFFRGLLCGMGIGFIIAPMRGQEMRRLVSERFQTLGESLPKSIQIPHDGHEISDRMTKSTSTFKERAAQGRTPVKRTTRRDTKVTPLVRSKSKQTEIHGAQAPEASPVPSSYETDAVGERSVSNDSLRAIPGMEPEVQRALEAQGIGTISQLLAQTTTKENRGVLAQSANIPIHHLKTLVDRADLLSLRGIRGDEAILLEEAGVTGCQDLHQRNPEHLYAILSQRHESGMAASFLPTRDQVTQWIAQAKTRATNVQRGQ